MAENQKKATDLIVMLENFFKQAPKLPASATDILVKIAPWLSLIFGILGVVVGLGALGLSPVALIGGINASFMVLATGVVSIVSSVLMLMAYPKLVKRQYKGWELLFWSEAISTVSAVLSLSIGSVLGVLIGFYLLFQIKSYYK
jgi:hypothetical protein